jgi:hypothetical protein
MKDMRGRFFDRINKIYRIGEGGVIPISVILSLSKDQFSL